jgi:DNA-binding NtrC family response regulator
MESILNGKKILAVDDEPDVLEILQEEIKTACPDCRLDKGTTFEAAKKMLNSEKYDIAILDIMGVNGFELLDIAMAYKIPVVMLTAHALSIEALKRSIQNGARAYLPKDKLGEVVPFLEDIVEYEAPAVWNRLFEKLDGYFDNRFGLGWSRSDDRVWDDFRSNIKGQYGRVTIK